MYELKIISRFAAAHQLREYEGGCERLHGHNWKVEVFISGSKLKENGLLMDFKVIKEKTGKILDELDHRFLNDLEAFSSLNPSSENIARHVFTSLSRELNSEDIRVTKVTAWESESACASYTEP
jgi:6-pyruvoyltetrahydropterin/6-carboxytetrahydropterin synthase